VIDEVLVQSPHVTVSLGRNTRGLVLDEFGALFTFDAGLGTGLDLPGLLVVPGVRTEEGVRHRRLDRAIPLSEDESELLEPDEWRKQAEATRREQIEGFEAELVDVLVDYGATLAELRDDQWVAVAAFLGGRAFLDSSAGATRLVVKVKMRDLRQHASGVLSREAVEARVKVERQ
jgi:hypothetical protein